VVEDNKINQKVAANMLKRMGHKATLVDDGQQAIDLIQKMQQEYIGVNLNNSTHRPTVHCFFDAVLMDIQMPVMDGLEATRRLRLLGYKDLPIFGLTASQKRSDFTELGFDDWLPKPIPMNDLSQKLHSLRERQKCTGSKECQEIKTDPVQQNMGPTECNTVMR
jgi:CheY-like chemotaxis protein